jgi:hypothetical protein
MTVEHTIAQLLGFVSLALGVSTFYQKNDRKLKVIMFIFNINHLIHFILLGSSVSAVSAGLSALRTGTSIYTSSKYVAAFFIITALSLGVYISKEWWDLWPIFGTALGTYSMFMLKGIRMRILFLISSFLWLTNNIIIGSIGGTLLEMSVIVMNSLTIYRMVRDQKRAAVA